MDSKFWAAKYFKPSCSVEHPSSGAKVARRGLDQTTCVIVYESVEGSSYFFVGNCSYTHLNTILKRHLLHCCIGRHPMAPKLQKLCSPMFTILSHDSLMFKQQNEHVAWTPVGSSALSFIGFDMVQLLSPSTEDSKLHMVDVSIHPIPF
eukprot:s3107_g7.t1